MTTPYPARPPAYAPLPPQHPRATLSLVLGIVAVGGFFLLLPLFAAPFAWYYGAVADRETERAPDRYRHGSARSGLVLGIIGTAILALVLVVVVVGGALTLLGTRYDAGYGT